MLSLLLRVAQSLVLESVELVARSVSRRVDVCLMLVVGLSCRGRKLLVVGVLRLLRSTSGFQSRVTSVLVAAYDMVVVLLALVTISLIVSMVLN